MEEVLIRKHIATALSKIIANGYKEFLTCEFAQLATRSINPNTMLRYIPREPLFIYLGMKYDYPAFAFRYSPTSFLSLQPSRDWLEVLKTVFTEDILDEWMALATQHTRIGAADSVIIDRAVALFNSQMARLRIKNQIPTEEKITGVREHIKTFWNVAYGHK
jgi:hypothetical protein